MDKVREIGWNPYPKPGGIADVTTGTDATGPQDSKLPYTRLRPAC